MNCGKQPFSVGGMIKTREKLSWSFPTNIHGKASSTLQSAEVLNELLCVLDCEAGLVPLVRFWAKVQVRFQHSACLLVPILTKAMKDPGLYL
jgi:hypothetical protein